MKPKPRKHKPPNWTLRKAPERRYKPTNADVAGPKATNGNSYKKQARRSEATEVTKPRKLKAITPTKRKAERQEQKSDSPKPPQTNYSKSKSSCHIRAYPAYPPATSEPDTLNMLTRHACKQISNKPTISQTRLRSFKFGSLEKAEDT